MFGLNTLQIVGIFRIRTIHFVDIKLDIAITAFLIVSLIYATYTGRFKRSFAIISGNYFEAS